MKKAKLYTIQEQEVLAHDRVRYFKQSPLLNLVHCEDKVLECNKTIDVPIIHIVESVRDTNGNTKYLDHYLAIDPKLRRLLQLATEADIKRHYAINLMDLKYNLTDFKTKTALLEDRVDYYNKLPWYKRIFNKV
jgi:hypothetical protein